MIVHTENFFQFTKVSYILNLIQFGVGISFYFIRIVNEYITVLEYQCTFGVVYCFRIKNGWIYNSS